MEKTLLRWLERGLISQEQYNSLLCDVFEQREKQAKFKTQITLYLIGALLLGTGVILFICANDWILKFLNQCYYLQILLMVILTTGSLYFGNKMLENNTKFKHLAQSLVFLSAILSGATYALLGQIYNTEADSAFLYFLWFISIYPLAFIFKNNPINILSSLVFLMCAFCYFSPLEGGFYSTLIFLLSGILFYCVGNTEIIKEKYNKFCAFYKTTGLVLIFITLLIYITCFEDFRHCSDIIPSQYLIFAFLIVIFNSINYFITKHKEKIFKIETFYLQILLCFAFLIMSNIGAKEFLAAFLSHIFLIFKISFLYLEGYKSENIKFITLANRFLTIYLIVNYIRFVSQYLEGAASFIIGGILLFSIGLYFEKKQKIY